MTRSLYQACAEGIGRLININRREPLATTLIYAGKFAIPHVSEVELEALGQYPMAGVALRP